MRELVGQVVRGTLWVRRIGNPPTAPDALPRPWLGRLKGPDGPLAKPPQDVILPHLVSDTSHKLSASL